MFASLTHAPIRFDLLALSIAGGLIVIWISMLAIWLYMMHQLFDQSVISLLRTCGGRELATRPQRLPKWLFNLFVLRRMQKKMRGVLSISVGNGSGTHGRKNSSRG